MARTNEIEEGQRKNTTGTDIQVLKTIERAFFRNNKAKRRNTERSIKWFSRYVPRAFNRIRTSQVMRDAKTYMNDIRIGEMYTFVYDALHKDELPIWDAQPLVFFFNESRSKSGHRLLHGINLHYLPPAVRARVFITLLRFKTERRWRNSTRLRLQWQYLAKLGDSKLFEHCVKTYREDHLRSLFIRIPAPSWELVLFLPLARWQKGGSMDAWAGIK